jgi:hypothetical protein
MTQEQFYLTLIAEECAEVAQRCSKAIRFGLDEVQKGQDLTNRERLLLEFNDLVTVMQMTFNTKLSNLLLPDHIDEKHEKVLKYIEYSKSLNKL